MTKLSTAPCLIATEETLPWNVVRFIPRRRPYQPCRSNGEVFTIGSPGSFAVVHYSSSGSPDVIDGFTSRLDAECAGWREARRRNAIFIFTTSEEFRDA